MKTDQEQRVKSAKAHILMCGDSGYFQHIAACLISLLESNADTFFHVVVAVTRWSSESNEKLQRSFRSYRNITLDVTYFDPKFLQGLPLTTAYPPEIYVRFWVENYFPDDVERVIYLDGDIVVTGSIEPLLTLEFGANVLAAVQIPGSDRAKKLGYDPKYGYFNSGVMVLNLPRWRAIKAKEILVNKAYSMAAILNDPDQDVLNACFHDQYIPIDYIWNAISPFFREVHQLPLTKEEVLRVAKNARIVHFNGMGKPWNYLCLHPHANYYMRCVSKTEWRSFRQFDYSIFNIFKKRLISLLGERRSLRVGNLLRRLRSSHS